MTDKTKNILDALGKAMPKLVAIPAESSLLSVQTAMFGEPLLDIKLADLLEMSIGDVLQIASLAEALSK